MFVLTISDCMKTVSAVHNKKHNNRAEDWTLKENT